MGLGIIATLGACTPPSTPPATRTAAPIDPRAPRDAGAGAATDADAGVPYLGLGDHWLGGADAPGGPHFAYLEVNFEDRTARIHPDSPAIPLTRAALTGERVAFGFSADGAAVSFEGDARGEAIAGTVRRVGSDLAGTFALRATRPYATDVAAHAAGTYRSKDGRTFFVDAGPPSLRLFDAQDGRISTLYATGPDAYVATEGAATSPWREVVHFAYGKGPLATSMTIEANGAAPVTATRSDPRTEELRVERGGATLAATLYFPRTAPPYPAIVYGHGSGRVSRQNFPSMTVTRVLLDEGFAVAVFDKRGVGQSGGEYVGDAARDPDNVSDKNVETLASDVAAVTSALAKRADIDRRHVGVIGRSQAGWILPAAGARSPDVKFMVLMAGPTVTTSLEDLHSELMHDGLEESDKTLDEVDAIIRKAPRAGYDPAPSIGKLAIPALWIFGALDTSIPVPESLRVLDAIKGQGAHDFSVVVLPDAGHSLLTVARDLKREQPLSRGYAAGFLPALRAWLHARKTH